MVGIPSRIATKKDLENLQQMAKGNKIDRKKWIKKLKSISEDTNLYFPVLEKKDEYIIISDTTYELPDKNEKLTTKDDDGKEKSTIKIFISNFVDSYYSIKLQNSNLVRLGVTKIDIDNMEKELV